jgi:hypothetical protein
MFAHAVAAKVFHDFEQADPECDALNWTRLIGCASRPAPRHLRASAQGPEWATAAPTVSLLYPRNWELSPRVRVFLDWVASEYAARGPVIG